MLNGDIFSELFLSNLDEKITSAGYEKGKQHFVISSIFKHAPNDEKAYPKTKQINITKRAANRSEKHA